VLLDGAMPPPLDAPSPEAADLDELDDEPPPDSQFESFYDEESGVWTLRRIPSAPPAYGAEDDAA
jgi:hypothetical protein